MKPVYVDLHIHTSNNPTSLNTNYEADTLLKKVSEKSFGADFLVSLTDHNVINQDAYIKAIALVKKVYPESNLILGVELHIKRLKNDENSKAYHCHVFFDFDINNITKHIIQEINRILERLYPHKIPKNSDKDIPLLENILDAFENYEILMLPHGGQNHSTFDSAVRESNNGKSFDTVMYNSLYYNYFDGFTSRSNSGTQTTTDYLKKLGVDQFVGLITMSDNYTPATYPEPKSNPAEPFIPTWMFATPTFDGLRLSLSDHSRLEYSDNLPRKWEPTITHISLMNSAIDMNINLTAGLNVIIGGSSSGKTLLVDTINRKLNNKPFDKHIDSTSIYNEKYNVENISIICRSGLKPYYLHQNYISNIINTHGQINEIEPLNKLFPDISSHRKSISSALSDLNNKIEELFSIVEKVEMIENNVKRTPVLSNLIITSQISNNLLASLNKIAQDAEAVLKYNEIEEDTTVLEKIHLFLKKHPLITHNEDAYNTIINELQLAKTYYKKHKKISEVILASKESIDVELTARLGSDQQKKREFDNLIENLLNYGTYLRKFAEQIQEIKDFKRKYETPTKEINGHKLYFEGHIQIDEDLIKDAFNKYLLNDKRVSSLQNLRPQDLYADNFSKNYNIKGARPQYTTTAKNVFTFISERDSTRAKILTNKGKDFDTLSPGKKTAVILDVILNFNGDNAPIIIDQPEDNLSSDYMNSELVELIKRVKQKKQIVFVSHNATIPLIGDAQNIILCRNDNDKIIVRSAPLEGSIDNTKVVDYIVKITDGGKQSVKKRMKKYNLRKFN